MVSGKHRGSFCSHPRQQHSQVDQAGNFSSLSVLMCKVETRHHKARAQRERLKVNKGAQRVGKPAKGQYPLAEVALLKSFAKRRAKGRRVSALWFIVKMRAYVRRLHPDPVQPAVGRGWFRRFVARNKLSYRRKTNLKQATVQECLPKIRVWHTSLRKFLQDLLRDRGMRTLDPVNC